MTRRPSEAFALALLDGAIGAALLAAALSHGTHREVLVRFGVYLAIVLAFKARDVVPRLPTLVAQARASTGAAPSLGPRWLRLTRLLIGYDSWSRTERFAIVLISIFVCTIFGWDDGGPFASALFLTSATVNGTLALVAWGARLSAR